MTTEEKEEIPDLNAGIDEYKLDNGIYEPKINVFVAREEMEFQLHFLNSIKFRMREECLRLSCEEAMIDRQMKKLESLDPGQVFEEASLEEYRDDVQGLISHLRKDPSVLGSYGVLKVEDEKKKKKRKRRKTKLRKKPGRKKKTKRVVSGRPRGRPKKNSSSTRRPKGRRNSGELDGGVRAPSSRRQARKRKLEDLQGNEDYESQAPRKKRKVDIPIPKRMTRSMSRSQVPDNS